MISADPSSGPTLDSIDASFLKTLWKLTFNVGGAHHSMAIRDEGTIEWVVTSVQVAGANREPMWSVAGLALHHIVREHPFIDCNHRAGWLLCRTLMHVEGYELAIPGEDVITFVKSIDARELDEQAVKEWVRAAFFRLG